MVEALRREPDARGSSEGELATVEEVDERVLEDLGPHLDLLERTVRKTADDRVGDVANTRLQRQEGLGQAPSRHFLREELNEVTSDRSGIRVLKDDGGQYMDTKPKSRQVETTA